MLAVVETMIAIAFSKKATNINIHNDLHNARYVCNSLQNKNPNTYRSRALNISAVIQTKCFIFSAVPSELPEFTKFPIKNFSCQNPRLLRWSSLNTLFQNINDLS